MNYWKRLVQIAEAAEPVVSDDALMKLGISDLSSVDNMIEGSEKFFNFVNSVCTSMLNALDGIDEIDEQAKLKKAISELMKKNADFNKVMMTIASANAAEEKAKEKEATAKKDAFTKAPENQPVEAPEQAVDSGAGAQPAFKRA